MQNNFFSVLVIRSFLKDTFKKSLLQYTKFSSAKAIHNQKQTDIRFTYKMVSMNVYKESKLCLYCAN